MGITSTKCQLSDIPINDGDMVMRIPFSNSGEPNGLGEIIKFTSMGGENNDFVYCHISCWNYAQSFYNQQPWKEEDHEIPDDHQVFFRHWATRETSFLSFTNNLRIFLMSSPDEYLTFIRELRNVTLVMQSLGKTWSSPSVINPIQHQYYIGFVKGVVDAFGETQHVQ